MKISVVIPAYNEENSIPNTLTSLANQKTKYDYEVIVVDNNSTDNTNSVSREFEKKMNLKVIKETRKGRGSARKRGFDEATGNIIASTDADTVVSSHWIDAIGNFFSNNPSSVAITALCRYPTKKISVSILNFSLPITFEIFRMIFGHYWLSGYSFAVRQDVYKKAGGFNTEIDGNEDSELASRISKIGKIEHEPLITVEASDRRFKDGLLKNLVPYFKTFYFMKRKKFNATTLDDKR